MSGTSLDGVDMALCSFHHTNGNWSFEIEKAVTVPYNEEWKKALGSIYLRDAFTLAMVHVEYGKLLGTLVKDFVAGSKADFISSHGHTVFHQPSIGLTLQIGEGAALRAAAELPVVCDFRTMDVALGGQGAPLVPIGDKLLFSEYPYCLNLGGIANISYDQNGHRIAYDICPVNMVLNYLAQLKGVEFDKNGELASRGKMNEALLTGLNGLKYYKRRHPKSLAREDFELNYLKVLGDFAIPVEDKLNTYCEHIAMQISGSVNSESVSEGSLLITGGGAFNQYLIDRIKVHCKAEVVIPDRRIIDFKEALIFAFLGVLRWRNENNCLESVTGAKRDSCSGVIYI
jgi:anhydro-N-acetylmuramic acid kinase